MAQDPWALSILETNYPSSKSVKIDGETDKVRRIVTLGGPEAFHARFAVSVKS